MRQDRAARLATTTALSAALLLCGACSAGSATPRSAPRSATSTASAAGSASDQLSDQALYGPDKSARAVADEVKVIADSEVQAGLPGALVLVGRGRRTVVVADGLADRASRRPMRAGDSFQIASVTKPMVSTVILSLVEEGKLRLDDTVEHWLPGLLPKGAAVTVEQLLDQSSGLADYGDEIQGLRFHRPWRPEQLLATIAARPLAFAPGTGQEYSSTNYIVLGLIAQRATGKTMADLLTKRVFDPAGMTSTHFQTVYRSPVHGYEGRHDVTLSRLRVAWTAGGVVSTAGDLGRFLRALLGGRLLDAPMLRRMMKTHDDVPGPLDGYGFGLWKYDTPCGAAYGHSGLIPGFATQAYATADLSRVAVAMVNVSDGSTTPQTLAEAALCG